MDGLINPQLTTQDTLDELSGVAGAITPAAPVAPIPAPAPVTTPAPTIPAPVVPQFQTTGKTTTTSTSKKESTPGYEAAIQKMDEAAALTERGFQEQAQALSTINALDSQAAQEKLAINQKLQAQEAEQLAKIDQQMNVARQDYDAKLAEYTNQKPESFWGSKSTGEKIGLAIALALGGYASGMTGGPNTALQIVSSQISDFSKKQDMLAAQRLKALELGKGKITDLVSARRDILADTSAKKAAAWENVALKAENLASKAKSQQQIGKLTELAGSARQEAAQVRAQFEQALLPDVATQVSEQQAQPVVGPASQTVTDTGKPMTEGQLKTQGFLDRAADSGKELDKFESEFFSDPKTFEAFKTNMGQVSERANVGAVPFVGRGLQAFLASDEDLASGRAGMSTKDLPGGAEYVANVRDFVRSVLRKESGAAIGADEFVDEYKRYFYVPGDDKASLKRKKALRRNALRSLRKETGKLSQPLYWEQEK